MTTDASRLLFYEPNELPALNSQAADGVNLNNISWGQEELEYSVNLVVSIPNRMDPKTNNDNNTTISNGPQWASFMKGEDIGENANLLTNAYTEISYQEIVDGKRTKRELMGIDSIDINFDAHFVPQVTVKITDVRGASLFTPAEYAYMQEERAKNGNKHDDAPVGFFKALFHFPYPKFMLSIKGFYGDEVTFALSVSDFKTAFNSQSGNFDVTIQFIGYMYGLYTDIPMNLIIAAPYFNNAYWKSSTGFTYEDGTRIITFIDFVNKYETALSEGYKTSEKSDETIKKVTKLNSDLKALKDLQTAFDAFKESFKQNFNGHTQIYDNENKILSFVAENKIEISDNLKETQENFIDELEKLNNQADDFSNLYTNYKTMKIEYSVQISNFSNKINVDDEDIIDKFDISDKQALKSLLENIKKEYGDETEKNIYITHLYYGSFSDELAKLKKDRNDRLRDITEEAETAVKDVLKESLGFNPSLENMYRMIFAHIDTFINYFSEKIGAIDDEKKVGTKRCLKEFGWKLKNTDLPQSKFTDTDWVCPFTAFFDEGNKREAVYPGDDRVATQKMGEMIEVGMVDEIKNSVEGYINEIKEAMERIERESEIGRASKSYGINFTPSSIADIFYNGVNPYNLIEKNFNTLNEKNVKDRIDFCLYSIYARVVSILSTELKSYNENYSAFQDEIIENEVNNFLESSFDYDNNFYNQLKEKNVNDFFGDYIDKLYGATGDTIQNNVIPAKIVNVCKSEKSEEDNIFNENIYNSFSENKHLFIVNEEVSTKTDKFVKFFDDFIGGRKISGERSNDGNIVIDKTTDHKKVNAFDDKGLTYEEFDPYDSTKSSNFSTLQIKGGNNIDAIRSIYAQSATNDYRNLYGDVSILTQSAPNNNYYAAFLQIGKTNGKKGVENLILGDDGKKNEFFAQFNKYDSALLFITALSSYFCESADIFNFAKNSNDISTLLIIPKVMLLFYGALCYYNSDEKYKNFTEKQSGFTNYNITGLNVKNTDIYMLRARDCVLFGSGSTNSDDWFVYDNLSEEDKVELIQYFKNWVDINYDSITFAANQTIEDKTYGYVAKGYTNGKYDEKNILVFNEDSAITKKITELLCEKVNVVRLVYNKRGVGVNKSNILAKIKDDLCNKLVNDEKLNKEEKQDKLEEKRKEFLKSMSLKKALYYTLKNLYDRWMCAYNEKQFKLKEYNVSEKRKYQTTKDDEKDKSEFDSFMFVDSFYNDIGQEFIVNPRIFYEMITAYTVENYKNASVFEFMAELAEKNRLLFMSLPVYNNFYDLDSIKRMFNPNRLYDVTENSLARRGIGNTYLIVYTDEVSNKVGNEDYADDGLIKDIDGIGGNQVDWLEWFKKQDNDKKIDYTVPVFNVAFGKQNQMYFKNISVNMDSPKVTDYSIANILDISRGGASGTNAEPYGIGQDIYSIYANRSYTCSVEMLGCMNIMPGMYFHLSNIPMFRGLYYIINVSHSVRPGDITTKFTGVRISRNHVGRLKLSFDYSEILNSARKNAESSTDGETKGYLYSCGDVVCTRVGDVGYVNLANSVGNLYPDETSSDIVPKNIEGNIEKLKKLFRNVKKYYSNGCKSVMPVETDSHARCTSSVKTWYGNLGYDMDVTWNLNNNSRSPIESKEEWEEVVVITGTTKIDINNKIKSQKNSLKLGDVCVEYPYNFTGHKHMCMWCGEKYGWRSDFIQNNAWIYDRGGEAVILRYKPLWDTTTPSPQTDTRPIAEKN